MPGIDDPFDESIYRGSGQGAYGAARRAQESQPYEGPLTPERLQGKQGEQELKTPVPGAQRQFYEWFFSNYMDTPRKREAVVRAARELLLEGAQNGRGRA